MILRNFKLNTFLAIPLILYTLHSKATEIDYIKQYVAPNSFLNRQKGGADQSNFLKRQLFDRSFLQSYKKINEEFKTIDTLNSSLPNSSNNPAEIFHDEIKERKIKRTIYQAIFNILDLSEKTFRKGIIAKAPSQFTYWLALEQVKITQAIFTVLKDNASHFPDLHNELDVWQRYIKTSVWNKTQ